MPQSRAGALGASSSLSAPRMTVRRLVRLLVVFYLLILGLALLLRPNEARAQDGASVTAQGFEAFLSQLWPDAKGRGVSRRTFEAAFAGVTPDAALLKQPKAQGEFTRTAGDYLTAALPAQRVAQARREAETWRDTLDAIERKTGVDRWVIVGVWGMESNFGRSMGGKNVVRSLATLAAARHRGDLFRDELLDALVIVEQGHVTPAGMIGSWAGAMGQTQFMPSSFLRDAVDFDGDGRKDIWTSIPDALASTAQFLKDHGWQAGIGWGAEVTLPQGFDLRAEDHAQFQPYARWSQRGVRRADGSALPARGEARLTLPMGLAGPAFLRTQNFEVIRDYNTSTSYALAVALLGDRAAGRAASPLPWPKEKALTAAQSLALQKALARQGYEVAKFDGKIGDKDRATIALWQARNGLVPDGHPSATLTARILAAR